MKIGRFVVCALMALPLAACGGGGGSSGGSGSGGTTTYSVGGTISGLSASGLVLVDNGGDNLSVPSGATSFTFATPLESGATYTVTVATQPTDETCKVTSGTGTLTASVTSVSVSCQAFYSVGGKISGLTASGLVLADNGGDNLSVSSGATSFTFATPLESGATYAVTVATQPTGETCKVTSGTGTLTASVTSVAVSCEALYSVGGKISGLSASGLVLADNGGDNLSVSSGATAFTFATPLQSGTAYAVTVATQPADETCTVAAGTGTVTADVTSISVSCKALYTIGGTISGLLAPGLVLADNGSDNLSVSSGATSFTFSTPLQSGTAYAVTVATQPTGETCAVASGTGTAMGNVSSVRVACTGNTYTISGTLSGLSTPGLKLQDYAGGEILPVSASAASFQFTNAVAYGTNVDVKVSTQPFWESCAAGSSNFSGPIASNITTDTFACTAAVASGAAVAAGTAFSNPAGVAVDASGDVYVADSSNNRILEVSPTGTVTVLLNAGNGLSGPEGVAVDSSGHVYVANTNTNTILEYSGGTVTPLATGFTFDQPAGVAVDTSGNVYVADTGHNAIEEISPSGVVTALGTSFTFSAPYGVAVDSSGNVYVADTGGSKVVEISGSTVTTLPGTFNSPFGIAVDSAGDIYVADSNDYEVRMISTQGNVTTLAGSSTTQGSCTASSPLFNNPFGVAVTAAGDLYVSDYLSSQVCELTPGP